MRRFKFYIVLVKENSNCYTSKTQQRLLHELAEIRLINDHFFLTGGTALSVFYLHHRASEDLDFFTISYTDLPNMSDTLRRIYHENLSLIQSSPMFLSYLINGVKVDFVIDPMSETNEPYKYILKTGTTLRLDLIDNISSNKLTAMVSRFEIKDIVDFYYISKEFWNHSEKIFMECYERARRKEALLDDPAAAAYQLEQSLAFAKSKKDTLAPVMRQHIEWGDLESVITDYIQIIYKLQQWHD
jgi:predicted nucleotidyltransferase component of viral defense system